MYVRVRAVDEVGRTVPDFSEIVAVEVDGPAKLIALDDGDHHTGLLFGGDEKCLRKGSLLAIFRAGLESGTVNIRFKVDGLPHAMYSKKIEER